MITIAFIRDLGYKRAIADVFERATVLFLGYGLRDEYVLRILKNSSAERPLFGIGPHFAVTADPSALLPSEVRRIRYVPEHADHRDSLLTLESWVAVKQNAQNLSAHSAAPPAQASPGEESLYYIADLLAQGTVQTGQTFQMADADGVILGEAWVGDGYVQGEVELVNYSAVHDVIVGVLCFDAVCVSIDRLSTLHELVGSETFWRFVTEDIVRIVVPPDQPAVLFAQPGSLTGDLGALSVAGEGTRIQDEFSKITIGEQIRKHLTPAPGREGEAERLFALLETRVKDLSHLGTKVPEKTRAVLLSVDQAPFGGKWRDAVRGGTEVGRAPCPPAR